MGNHQWDIPAFVAKSVATSGHFSDLTPLQIGIFDTATGSVATAAGNGKEFFLACGSPHTRDQLTKFYGGMRDAKKSSEFLGKDLLSFEKSNPSVPRNEEWVFGYGGGKDDKSLSFLKDEKYQLKIRLFGDPILKKFNKTLSKIITVSTASCPEIPCEGCAERILDPKATAVKVIEQINGNVELQEFKLKASLISSDFTSTTANAFKYRITVVDSGDADGLFALQRTYPTLQDMISRVSYVGGRSVYELNYVVAVTAAAGRPAAFQSIAWVDAGSGFTIARTLKATVPPKEGGATYTVAEINDLFAGQGNFVAGSAADVTDSTGTGLDRDNCNQVFTIQQLSNFLEQACMSADVASFPEFTFVVNGAKFEAVPAAVTASTVKVGIKFSAPFFSVQFNDASYNPYEFYDVEPIRMEISVYDQTGNVCKFGSLEAPRRVVTPRYRNLDGSYVRTKVIENGAYFTYDAWCNDPRLREVMDNVITQVIDKNKFYVAYYLRFKESRNKDNFGEKGQIWEPVIFVEQTDTATQTALEAALTAITNKFDVSLETRA